MQNSVLFTRTTKLITGGRSIAFPLLNIWNSLISVFILLFIFLTTKSYSQKEYNNWYFGINAGITFNSGNPIALTNNPINIGGEGCATISDKSGNLLFYTDGCTVYNKIHGIMANGTGLQGSVTATQSALIVQKPCCNSTFYIFTVYYEGNGGLSYSIVDLEKKNGLGEVVQKNILLADTVTEKLTAIRHSNGVDLWIIAHEFNSNGYLSFLLSHNGINANPIKSFSGKFLSNLNAYNAIGYLKPSPNGIILCDALSGLGYYQLLKFNRGNGIIDNPVYIFDTIPDLINGNEPYGIEFSPNGMYLYAKQTNYPKIFQYKVNILDSGIISNSKVIIGESSQFGRGFQIGPDNKIYMANTLAGYTSSIEFPNKGGAQCEFVDSSVFLAGKMSGMGLPNNPFTAPYIQYDGCYTGNYAFHLTDTTYFVKWDFGDPAHPNNTALGNDPNHVYTMPGTYTITAIYLTDWNTYDTAVSTVWAVLKPKLFLADTIKVCGNQNVQLKADSIFDHYVWNTGDSAADITVNGPGLYTVTASDCGCSVTESVLVWGPEIKAPSDLTVCPGVSLVLSATYPGATYLWNTGSNQPIIPISEPGLYWVDIHADTCQVRDSCNVSFNPLTLSLGNDTVICEGQSVYLDAIGLFDSLVWWDGQTTTSRIITDAGSYAATAYYEGCSLADSVKVKLCTTISFPNVFTPNGDGKNDLFKPVFKAVEQYHLLVFDRWGRSLFETSDPEEGWDGSHNGSPCPVGTYYFSASYLSQSLSASNTDRISGVIMLLR